MELFDGGQVRSGSTAGSGIRDPGLFFSGVFAVEFSILRVGHEATLQQLLPVGDPHIIGAGGRRATFLPKSAALISAVSLS